MKKIKKTIYEENKKGLNFRLILEEKDDMNGLDMYALLNDGETSYKAGLQQDGAVYLKSNDVWVFLLDKIIDTNTAKIGAWSLPEKEALKTNEKIEKAKNEYLELFYTGKRNLVIMPQTEDQARLTYPHGGYVTGATAKFLLDNGVAKVVGYDTIIKKEFANCDLQTILDNGNRVKSEKEQNLANYETRKNELIKKAKETGENQILDTRYKIVDEPENTVTVVTTWITPSGDVTTTEEKRY